MERSIARARLRSRRTQRRVLWFISLLLLLIVGVAVGTSHILLRSAEAELYQELERDMLTQVQQRSSSFTVLFGTLQSQVKQIASADVLRLFATEVASVDADVEQLLRLADAPASEEGDTPPEKRNTLEQLAARVPLMRTLLNDFLSRTDFIAAELITSGLHPCLYSGQRSFLLQEDRQRAAAQRVLETGVFAVLPIQGFDDGKLAVVVFYPIYAPLYMTDAGDKPQAVLALLYDVTAAARNLVVATGTHHRGETGRLLQKTDHGIQEVLPPSGGRFRDLPEWTVDAHGNLPPALRSLPEGTVFSLGMGVPNLPWIMAEDILLTTAQESYEDYRSKVLLVAVSSALIAALLLGMVWWWMLGRSERAVSREMEGLYTEVNRQKQLLDGINGALADGIALTDKEGRLQYVNNAFATMFHKTTEEILGRLAAEALGSDVAGNIKKHTETLVIRNNDAELFTETLLLGKEMRHFQVACSFFREADSRITGVVSVYRDITSLVNAQEHAQRMVNSVVNVLVRAIEAVDPYLRGQSTFTGNLARTLVQHLKLGASHESTVRAAANLSQIGIIQIRRSLVTKAGRLTPEERAELQRHVEYARNALEGIDFGLPVLPAICQMHEHMDGSGYPQGLRGEEIVQDARILSVANTFCAVLRPRSYRQARTVEEALGILSETPPKYDPAVVQALREYLETPEGQTFLHDLREKE